MDNALKVLKNLSSDEKTFINLLIKNGPVSKHELSLITNMKLSTLHRLLVPLEEKGLLVEMGVGESSGGRKPVLYSVNPKGFYIAGVDISRTYTRVMIHTLTMKAVLDRRFAMDEGCTPQETVRRICDILQNGMKEIGSDMGQLAGIGVGTVGPVDKSSGVIINPARFPAPGWEKVPLKSMFEAATGCPVIIDNGANAAVLAEYHFVSKKGLRSIAYFHCGVGIRTGVISSGILIRTINDAEDAFGHMVVDIDGDACYCGNYGCIECYSTMISIVGKFIAELKKGKETILSKPVGDISFTDICKAAEQEDDLAKHVITDAAVIFGTGLANYIHFFDPDLVILSGPLVKSSELFYRLSTETALKKCRLKGDKNIIFSREGNMGDRSIAVGAAYMVWEGILNETL